MVKLKALRRLSVPKNEAAARRIEAGEAEASDWRTVKEGAAFAPPAALRDSLIEAKDAEEVAGK
jgi:hypothetical protein